MGQPAESEIAKPTPGRLKRLIQRIWWLHSFVALFFGVGVMLFARAGLAYADKILMVLMISWLLMFGALRFIVGPANRAPDERFTKKGVRLVTNYVIKQLYQQMFFFLVPLYATSATWSLTSFNWWLAPLLLLFAVLSTMDLVFDNFIMERRVLASFMYGIAMFGVLNVILPLVTGMPHFAGLMFAAMATPPAVALLSFSAKTVFSAQGIALTLAVTAGSVAGAYYGRALVPPAPISMLDDSVGHGPVGGYECLPPNKRFIRLREAEGLRCGALVTEPGGLSEPIYHEWRGPGVRTVVRARSLGTCDEKDDVGVYVSSFDRLANQPLAAGKWKCITRTEHGQIIGVRSFEIIEPGPADALSGEDGSAAADGGLSPGTDGGSSSRSDAGSSSRSEGTPTETREASADAATAPAKPASPPIDAGSRD